jgi:hypothetical protein
VLICVRAASAVDCSPPETARGQVAGTRENGDRLLPTEVVHAGAGPGPGLGAGSGGVHPGAGAVGAGLEPASVSGGHGGADVTRPVGLAGSGRGGDADATRPVVPAGSGGRPLGTLLGPGSQTAGGGGQA